MGAKMHCSKARLPSERSFTIASGGQHGRAMCLLSRRRILELLLGRIRLHFDHVTIVAGAEYMLRNGCNVFCKWQRQFIS